MRFRRRARAEECAEGPAKVEPEQTRAATGKGAAAAPVGTYLTDGRSLFRVQHAITDADGLHLHGDALLELEDCRTLELILCSAGALERLGLRPVRPSQARLDADRQSVPASDGGLPAMH
jgi:hypothetical protein